MLRDLVPLQNYFKNRCPNEWPSITFDEDDEIQLNVLFDNGNNTKFELLGNRENGFHSKTKKTGNQTPIIPEYILMAVFQKPYAYFLRKYCDLFDEIKSGTESDQELGEMIEDKIIDFNLLSYTLDPESINLFTNTFHSGTKLMGKKIVNDRDKNRKYNIRGTSDWFGSTMLATINIPNASSGCLSDILYLLACNNNVYSYFEDKYLRKFQYIIKDNSNREFREKVLIFLEHNGKLPQLLDILQDNKNGGGSCDLIHKVENEEEEYKTENLFRRFDHNVSEAYINDIIKGETFFIDSFFYKEKYHFLLNQSSETDIDDFSKIIENLFPEYKIDKEDDSFLLKTSVHYRYPTSDNSDIAGIFYKALTKANLSFEKNLACRFISSLQTKPFVILTGVSGSGKTKLAESFAQWISEDSSQYCMVSVGADWTSREPLLGYPNALVQGGYVKDSFGVLNLIIEANKNISKPYFLILDEMNMSHVERYFADFLSAMESADRNISLHEEGTKEEERDVPYEVQLPKNLFIVGTVNIDETTYMFSPKVLDRAIVIDFRVKVEEITKLLKSSKELNLDIIKHKGSSLKNNFVETANKKGLSSTELLDVNEPIVKFFEILEKEGLEFGYRTAYEMKRFINICYENASKSPTEEGMTKEEIIDAAVIQKLLPRLHGSKRHLKDTLVELCRMCLENEPADKDVLKDKFEDEEIKYKLSFIKLRSLNKYLEKHSFASFAG